MSFVSINGMSFPTLVARTEAEQQVGLMHKPWPPPIMCFPYETAGIRRFWMKNTISPLDIIFCNANKVIGIYRGEPLSTSLIGPSEASDLVVELPAGMADRMGLKIGDYVGFSAKTG
jgi:uncharacterized protein